MKVQLGSVVFAATLLVAPLAHAVQVLGVTATGQLVFFDTEAPGLITTTIPITGLVGGGSETVVGIDHRPATGELFAMTNASRLYRLNGSTGAATQVGADGAFTLTGTSFGFGFNPVPDRIRVVSDANQNLRLNPNNGALAATDGSLAYAGTDVNAGADPNVVAVAYTDQRPGFVFTTTLYDIDSALDILTTQNPPNAGVLNTVGSLGVDTGDNIGFDNDGFTGIAYASLQTGSSSSLYTINLTTGAATLIGDIDNRGDLLLLDIAVIGVAEPGTLALFGMGLLGLAGARRRRAIDAA
jgi:hypothetical protein